ncbi:hypothetical protein ARAM_000154 [Aspergillus rambellii]|uniref:Uncharacterized protein n=2 Tax=Aspergillus subgen. Nidulantes TaxID=2720870 RepID=A0A0F8VC13_9EURO|nr:hypothetical protein ARAM_000154 [Aspergillus rambellii]
MRHRHVSISDSESEYSESDVSMMEAPRYRRRSVSRTRHNPSYSTTYLTPVMQDVRVHRSASTGRRTTRHERELERERDQYHEREKDQYREREKDQYRERVQPTAVIVDIKNESANKSVDRSGNKTRKTRQREENTYIDPYESEDETVLRRPRRSNRVQASASVSRDASPRPPARDYDLVIDQRMLEKNDQRQDLELLRQQQEIERLERQLARHREDNEFRILKEEEDRYEDDISDRLRRLQRYEEKERADEEQRKAERQLKLQKLEQAERADEEKHRTERELRLQKLEQAERVHEEQRKTERELRLQKLEQAERAHEEQLKTERELKLQKLEQAERADEEKRRAEHRLKLQKLERAEREAAEKDEVRQKLHQEKLQELQRKIEEEEKREKIKKEIRDEEIRKKLEDQERLEKEKAMKAAAVEEWKLAEQKRILKELEEKAKKEKEFKDRLRIDLGYTEEEIEAIINKKHGKDKEKEKKDKDDENKEEDHKATWIKVHRKHLLPDTLIAYQLPWAWDERDGNYIIIKTWVSEDLQEELFAHTRRLREGKLITQTSSTLTELKVNDRKKDKMYIVRKKSPSRRAWIFT